MRLAAFLVGCAVGIAFMLGPLELREIPAHELN